MWLLVGLGNPGTKYQHNRHNIGFMAVDAISAAHKFTDWQKKFDGQIATGTLAGEKVVLLKPQTYMNLSGKSVQAASAFYKILPAHIIVLHDEIDIAPGKIRIKQGGGDGGHNGLKSIDQAIGPHYHRVRLGVGRSDNPEMDTADYVLSNFNNDDQKWLALELKAIAEHAVLLLNDHANFMNKVSWHSKGPNIGI